MANVASTGTDVPQLTLDDSVTTTHDLRVIVTTSFTP
jgi:hypothetical protein